MDNLLIFFWLNLRIQRYSIDNYRLICSSDQFIIGISAETKVQFESGI